LTTENWPELLKGALLANLF